MPVGLDGNDRFLGSLVCCDDDNNFCITEEILFVFFPLFLSLTQRGGKLDLTQAGTNRIKRKMTEGTLVSVSF